MTADHAPVLREHGYHPIPVKAIVQETDDTRSFVLDVPADLRGTFTYRPGQFCTFRVRVGGEELMRCYSMSSAPELDEELTVTVKRVPAGLVSNWFNDAVAVGDILEVTKPAGVFCPRRPRRPRRGVLRRQRRDPGLLHRQARARVDRPARQALGRQPRP